MIIKNKTISSILKGNQTIDKIMKGTLVVYESWKNLIANGVPPLTLTKCKGVDLIDYKLYGNSKQEGENLFDINSVGDVYISDTVIRTGQEFTFEENKTLIISAEQYNGNRYYRIKSNGVFSATYQILAEKTIDLPAGDTLIIYSTLEKDLVGLKVTEPPTPNNPVEIESVGDKTKNLLKRLVKGIGLDFNKGTENIYSDYASSDYIQVDFNINPNYYLSGLLNTLNSCVFAYNKDKVFLGRTSGQGRLYISLNKNIFTSGTAQGTGDIAYLRVSQYVNINLTGTIDDIDNAKIQLEIGTTKTDYEPYGYRIPVKVSNESEKITTNIYLNEPLRKVGDYADYIDFANNKVVRKIYEYAFKGTEQVYAHPTDTKYAIGVPVAGVVGIAPLSNYYQGSNKWWSGLENGFISLNTTGGTTAGINNSNYTTEEILRTSLVDLYAQGQPLTVTYALATPIEEAIELPNIPTFKGTTILSVDTTIQPSNLEVVYKGKN